MAVPVFGTLLVDGSLAAGDALFLARDDLADRPRALLKGSLAVALAGSLGTIALGDSDYAQTWSFSTIGVEPGRSRHHQRSAAPGRGR